MPESFIYRLITVRTRQRTGFQEIDSRNRYRTPEGCNSASGKTFDTSKVYHRRKNYRSKTSVYRQVRDNVTFGVIPKLE